VFSGHFIILKASIYEMLSHKEHYLYLYLPKKERKKERNKETNKQPNKQTTETKPCLDFLKLTTELCLKIQA
jgi:hypothetical protein